MQRNSVKRQAILECLRSTDSHPTAEWIFAQLKPTYPNLSLATVYRNLTQFKRDGLIQSVGTVSGHERFDGNASPHVHVVCSCCGTIADASTVSLPQEIIVRVQRLTGFTIDTGKLQFTGLCSRCRRAASSQCDELIML